MAAMSKSLKVILFADVTHQGNNVEQPLNEVENYLKMFFDCLKIN